MQHQRFQSGFTSSFHTTLPHVLSDLVQHNYAFVVVPLDSRYTPLPHIFLRESAPDLVLVIKSKWPKLEIISDVLDYQSRTLANQARIVKVKDKSRKLGLTVEDESVKCSIVPSLSWTSNIAYLYRHFCCNFRIFNRRSKL